MTIDELVSALQPLAGWHVHAVSEKFNDTFSCHSVRRLERRERVDSRTNVILTSTKEPEPGQMYGLVYRAKDTVRVDWSGDRVWIENKGYHLAYIQRVRPIIEESTE